MKSTITLFLLIITFFQLKAQEPSLEIEFTTIDMGGFTHENHVLAVWIETNAVEFVKTPLVYADIRKSDLFTWNGAPAYGNEVDAITGATQEYHKTYTIIWNCMNLDQNVIPNGDYILHIEMNNNHSQGPLAEIDFTIDGNSFTLNPEDEEFFKDISLVYNANATSHINNNKQNNFLNISPNPADAYVNMTLNLNKDEILSIMIVDNKLRPVKYLAYNKHFSSGENTIRWDIESKTANGTYFVYISSKNHVRFGKQIIVNRF